MVKIGSGKNIISTNQIANGVIVDADINASAAIAGSKLQALSVGVNAGVIPSTGVADAHVSASAAIAYSKLNLGTSIVNADISASAAIAGSKLQELSVGANAGVIPSTGVANAHIAAAAAIADSKLATISTAGKVDGAALTGLANIPVGAGLIPAANVASGTDLTCIPRPVIPTDGVSTRALNNPVDGYLGLFNLPRKITLNKLTFNVTAVGASGTFKIGIFSEDGQTKYGEAETASISSTGEKTVTFSNLALPAGNLIFLAVSVGSANITVSRWGIMATVTELKDLTSEPSICGVLTVTSGTIPATVTIASISASEEGCFVWRLDN